MKRLLILAALALAGCATTSTTGTSAPLTMPTPAQVAQVACPVIQATLTTLSTPGIGLDATTQADLTAAAPVVSAVCQASAQPVTVASIQQLGSKIFPTVQAALAASNLPNKDTLEVQVGLGYSVMQVVLTELQQPAVVGSAILN